MLVSDLPRHGRTLLLCMSIIFAGPMLRARAQDAALLEAVPGDAVAVFSVYPKEIAALGELEMFPREVISAVGLKEWSIDPLEVEKALVVAGKFTDTSPPQVFLVLRFAAAPAAQKAFSAQRASEKLDKLAGKERYRTRLGADVLMLDDKTLAFGPEKALIWMTRAGEGSPFVALVRKAPKKHLSLAIDVEAVRPTLAKAFTNLPPPLHELSKAVEITRFAQAQFDLSLAGQWRIALHAANEKDAAALKKIAATQVEFGAQIVRAQLPKAAASQDPVQRAWGVYLGRAMQKTLELTTPAQEGAEVSLTMRNDKTLTTAIGLLASTAVPSIMSASASAGRAQDQNRLKMLLLAMHNYHDTYRGFPQRAVMSEAGKPLLSWRVQILPFVEQQALYEQFHLDEPWDSEHNQKLIDKMPDVFRAKGDAANATTTRYQVLKGEGVLLNDDKTVSLANVTDGTSNTIAIVQTSQEKAVPWTKPDDLPLNEKKPQDGMVDAESGGFLAAFADGSVHWIPASIDDASLKALITRAGGEVVQFDFGR